MEQVRKPNKSGDKKQNSLASSDLVYEGSPLQWRLEQWFPDIDQQKHKDLRRLQEELIKFNKAINLVSAKTMVVADAIHFADSILASRTIMSQGAMNEIYDFGSGGGFPGLVFGILYPEVKIHLIEVDQRKAEFLKHCIATLEIKNADVVVKSIEALPPKSVGYAMSRGLAAIPKAILMTRRVFAKGGRYYHLKGEEWATEIADIPTQLCSFWIPGLVGEYKLPVGEIKFAVVKTDKIAD